MNYNDLIRGFQSWRGFCGFLAKAAPDLKVLWMCLLAVNFEHCLKNELSIANHLTKKTASFRKTFKSDPLYSKRVRVLLGLDAPLPITICSIHRTAFNSVCCLFLWHILRPLFYLTRLMVLQITPSSGAFRRGAHFCVLCKNREPSESPAG